MHIRKIARSVIVAGLALAMTVTTAFASLGTATVTASPSLRLRSAASTSSTTLRTAPKGASVEVLSEKENGWYKVSYNGIVGYMSADWLKVSPSTGSNASTSSPSGGSSSATTQTGTVTYALNVRSGPGTSYGRIATLSKGTTVTILSSTNGWYSIKAGSMTGYVSAQYVSVNSSSGSSSSNNNSSSSSSGNGSSTSQTGTVTYTLNVRSGPGTSYGRIATLSKGTTVTILSSTNGWYSIKAGSMTGYVSAQYVSVNSSSGSSSSSNNSSSSSSGNSSSSSSSGSSSSTALKSGKTTTALNVRSGPGTSYSRVATLSKGATVTILSTSNGWHQIASGSVTGYVSADYVTVDASSSATLGAYVNAGPLNVRSGPGTSYSKVGSIKERTKVTILESNGGWYKIESGSLTGYVSAEYITFGNPPSNSSSSNNNSSSSSNSSSSNNNSTPPTSSSPSDGNSSGSNVPASSVGEQAAAIAKSLLGCPYVYGAAGPRSFDCSGLSYYIYGQLGYKLGRGSSSQYNNNGTFVSIENAQPGDLVFFFDPRFDGSGGTLPTTHMGICVGGGKFIHASTTSYRVQYDDLFNSYYTKFIVGVKRIA